MAYNGSYNNGDDLKKFAKALGFKPPVDHNVDPAKSVKDAMYRLNPSGDEIDQWGKVVMKKEDMTKDKMLEDWIKKEKTGTNPEISKKEKPKLL